MTEFGGYLWVGELGAMRSPDRGQTWEYTGSVEGARFPFDWAVWDKRLYAVGVQGMARWNETEGRWEDLRAGLRDEGLYMFDHRTETSAHAGLNGLRVRSLVSH